jgi:hypothetical protein
MKNRITRTATTTRMIDRNALTTDLTALSTIDDHLDGPTMMNNNSYSKPSYQQQDKSKMYASRGCYNVSRRTSLRHLDLGTKKLMNPYCYSVETVSRCVFLGLWRCGTARQRGDFGSRERRRFFGMSGGAKRQSRAFEDARRTLRGCG